MRYSVLINQVKAIEWGLNSQQSILFAFVYGIPSWADNYIANGAVWYNISKQKICNELPILTDKPDTAYRLLKQLEELGVIIVGSFNNKTFIQITEKGRKWEESDDKKDDFSEENPIQGSENFPRGSEKNPSRVGKKSELGSEKNPTNKVINISSNKYPNKSIPDGIDLFSGWPEKPSEQVWKDYKAMRKAKKAPVSDTVMKRLGNVLTQCVMNGFSVDECLSLAIMRNWQGLELDWVLKNSAQALITAYKDNPNTNKPQFKNSRERNADRFHETLDYAMGTTFEDPHCE